MTFGTASAAGWTGDDATTTNPTVKYGVGGAVTGLAGPVVLQDNAGDDLTVNSDGPFEFPTPLTDGAGYSVTIKQSPAGQTCTTANADGTIASASVTNITITCIKPPPPGHDDFARADSGGLGAGWAAMTVGGLAISGDTAVGTSSGYSGDVRTGEDYGSDQYSQIALSSQLSGGAWIGPTVRSQPGSQETYLAIYFWDEGNPKLELYKGSPVNDNWGTPLGIVPVAPLPAGTTLTLVAVGSQITLLENGIERISVTVGTLTGGAPGLLTLGTASAAGWSGDDATTTNTTVLYGVGGAVTGLAGPVVLQDNAGDDLTVNSDGPFEFPTPLTDGAGYSVTIKQSPAGQTCTTANAGGTIASASVTNITITCTPPPKMRTQFEGTDANGISSYAVTSSDDGGGTQMLRVLTPTDPAAGVPHNFLYVLPVEPNQGTQFGDGIETLSNVNAQNQYNLTIIEPSFPTDPWYADNPDDANIQYETFMTQDLVPWVQQTFGDTGGAGTGGGQNWLIGFSKSGLGAQDLLLKYPQLFSLAASWDFPADMNSYSQFGSSSAPVYGTDANFQANYRLTPSFLDAHKAPFLSSNRIWIGGYEVFQTDMADYDALLTSEGIQHTTETPQAMAHGWDSGWVQIALSALSQDGAALPAAS